MNFGGEPGFYRLRTVPAVHDIKAITALEGSAGEIRNCALGMPGPWEHSGILCLQTGKTECDVPGSEAAETASSESRFFRNMLDDQYTLFISVLGDHIRKKTDTTSLFDYACDIQGFENKAQTLLADTEMWSMRKAQKQQAEDFVKLLGQAHGEIRKAIEKRNISTALSLLADCQDGAIALGELIEKADGEGAPTIPILESYCEQVYEIHEELKKGQPVGAGRVFKSLRQMLFKIENSVKHDIRLRKEAVFLPYKASMWDSLESIWKAADEDPDCDAYVIPIPYYDKNPDGSFKELHYEGGEYPKSVPVIWYEDYDFQKRRPDMIFIHNPYDECNLVTSVHPFFYARNLKQFTDKLVYVPYFILGEVDPANKKALEGLCKFCLVPGVIYADQVIVQSENMRQAYINVLTESLSSQGRNREYWKKKIDGSGSPKVDKVLSTEKEDLEIPEEWMKVIRKPDGSWKKIVFYNTTVTALLQHNEKYLAKLREVLQIFYENRDQVALLWRPHPLFVATIESMRPELEEIYENIVEEYRKAGWGIYDDSFDIERAVVINDAYYGDESSVMQMCQAKGKLVMIQNPSVLDKIL